MVSTINRFEFDDERLQKLLHMIHECFRVIDMSGGLLNLIPWIRHLAPNLSGYRPLVNAHTPLWKFIEVKSAPFRYPLDFLFYNLIHFAGNRCRERRKSHDNRQM